MFRITCQTFHDVPNHGRWNQSSTSQTLHKSEQFCRQFTSSHAGQRILRAGLMKLPSHAGLMKLHSRRQRVSAAYARQLGMLTEFHWCRLRALIDVSQFCLAMSLHRWREITALAESYKILRHQKQLCQWSTACITYDTHIYTDTHALNAWARTYARSTHPNT